MLKKLLGHNAFLAVLSGTLVFLAFERFNIVPLIFLFAIPLNRLAFQSRGLRSAFGWGFLMSFVVMLGGFYWVTYVLHEFGYLPWAAAGFLFLGFCGFGALNFPIYTLAVSYLSRKIPWERQTSLITGLWFAIALPALYTVIEYFVPKLFPWYAGHALYRATGLIQIVEVTGSIFLSFLVYSMGSTIGLLFFPPVRMVRRPWEILLFPLGLVAISVSFSQFRLQEDIRSDKAVGRTLRVAMIQANIGSLEKMESEKTGGNLIDEVINRYAKLTDEALTADPKPDLILWPETAMPFGMNANEKRARQLKTLVSGWKVPLLTGSYSQSTRYFNRDLNAAYLLDPDASGAIQMQSYMKNILLAFGEYLPLGSTWPKIYQYFPQIADFERGTEQNPIYLRDGTPLGVTICYEAIVPEFFKKTVRHPILGVINLTNDSWFGPTSEPHLHGSLTIFRAIENRLPLFRATNTGLSFGVDSMGRQTQTTSVFKPGVLQVSLVLPATTPHTFYRQYGDWLILLLSVIFCVFFILSLRRAHAPVPH